MKYYFAGADSKRNLELLKEQGAGNVLTSYFNLSKSHVTEYKEFNTFLDSGAYSALTKGTPIDIQEYIGFLKLHGSNFNTYANLDAIGDADETFRNQSIMEQEDLKPLPCFHYGEDFKWLKYYADNYEYFAIGGLVPYSKDWERMTWFLDKVFAFLAPYFEKKPVKLHGFGVGSPRILERYPFYSADSTSWLSGGTFGTMVVWNPQKFKFTEQLHYSEKEKMLKSNVDIKTLDSYHERQKHNIREYLKMESDISKLWATRGIDWNIESK